MVRNGLGREADFSYWQCYEALGYEALDGPIAQLDRVTDFYSVGCRFESCWDRQDYCLFTTNRPLGRSERSRPLEPLIRVSRFCDVPARRLASLQSLKPFPFSQIQNRPLVTRNLLATADRKPTSGWCRSPQWHDPKDGPSSPRPTCWGRRFRCQRGRKPQ
jgi:hypothetical protein